MEKYDSSRLRRMKETIIRFPKQSAIKPLLARVSRATRAHMYWMALGFLAIVGIFFFWDTSTIIETNKSRVQLRMLLNELQRFLSAVNDAETGQRGYLLVGDESYLEPYQNAVKVANQEIDRVEKLMNAVPGQRPTFDAMQHLVAMKFAELKKTVQLRQSEGKGTAIHVVRTDDGKKLMDEIRGVADQIRQEIQELLAKHDRQTGSLAVRATRWGILGSLLAGFMFVSFIQRERRECTQVVERSRQLVRSAESSRIQAIAQSKGEIESLGQRARVLAEFVQTLQEQTHTESDKEIA